MDVEFRNVNGERVGFIIGTDVKDNSGNRVGYITGTEIRDSGGNRAGMYSGNTIKDNYGNRIGYLNGNEIRDTYGNRVGYPVSGASEIEIIAAALLLFDLEPETAGSSSTSYSRSSGGGGDGEINWWAIVAVVLFFAFHLLKAIFKCIFLTKGGRIGLIAAGVLTGIAAIIMVVTYNFEAATFIGISASLIVVCGLIGSGIGAIVRTAKERKEEDAVKRWLTVFLLSFFLGLLGVDRFFVRKIGTGIIKLLTLGGLGVWWIIDWCMILSGRFTDKDDIEV